MNDQERMWVYVLALATALIIGLYVGMWIGESRALRLMCHNPSMAYLAPEACE